MRKEGKHTNFSVRHRDQIPISTRDTPIENARFSADACSTVSLSRKYDDSVVVAGADGNENLVRASKMRSWVVGHRWSMMASKNYPQPSESRPTNSNRIPN